MQVTVRLTDVMSKRLQILLDRGLTKTHVLHEALDQYLPLLEEAQPQKQMPPKQQPTRTNKKRKRR